MHYPRRVILDHRCAAGDTLVITAAVRSLHEQHPGAFLTDFVGHHGRKAPKGFNLFANSPYITEMDPSDSEYVMLDYGPSIQKCGRPYHFISAIGDALQRKLGVPVSIGDFRPEVWLSPQEKELWSGLPERYAIIDAGYKRDFTAKHWSTHRYQQVVNATKNRIQWVQIGAKNDVHPELDNVINLVAQTTLRDLCQVMYRASLVLTPVSLPMHLAAAVPTIADGPVRPPMSIDDLHRHHQLRRMGKLPDGDTSSVRYNRPCVVLMGSREPRQWEAYPGHVTLGTTGKLSCGEDLGGGCWRNKTVQIDSDESVCRKPLRDEVGQFVPECLHRVSVQDVVRAVESFL